MQPVVKRVYVWDRPTRVFHWSLVVLLGFSWWSAKAGQMDWHRYSGLTTLGLLAFRIIWGFIGSRTARFAQFVKPPRAVLAYVSAQERPVARAPGHNPLGGWSVMLLLLLLTVQVVSGVFAVDVDGIESGPLSYLVDFDQGRMAARIHHLSFALLQAAVVLHVAAILFYLLFKRRNLIGAMLTGYGTSDSDVAPMTEVSVYRIVATAVVAAVLSLIVASGLQNPFAS